MNNKPLILVTNDDGIFAPGIKALVEVARQLGDVIVVAPDSPQSAKGHALTLTDPLRLKPVKQFEGIECYACSGTPVDCVKIAKDFISKKRPIDLCVSGVNHGSNASINIIYSGTVSAAMEASLEGIPSLAFSLLDFSFDANFEPAKPYMKEIITKTLEKGLGDCKLLNINFPKSETFKGIKVCRQANARWVENYVEAEDPRGEKYYWLTGEFINSDKGTDTDLWALENGYISIVPSQHDLTHHTALPHLKHFE